MKKYRCCIWISFFLLIACKSTQETVKTLESIVCDGKTVGVDREKEKLKGKVQSIMSTVYEITDLRGDGDDNEIKDDAAPGSRKNFYEGKYIEFNTCGYYVRHCDYERNNKTRHPEINEETLYEYDTSGLLMKKSLYDYDWGKETIYRYTYGKENRIDKINRIERGGVFLYEERLHYNNSGIMFFSEEFSDGSNSPISALYRYDNRGNCIEKNTIGHRGYPIMCEVWAYDENNNEILREYYGTFDQDSVLVLKSKEASWYDGNNNPVKVIRYSNWGNKNPSEIKYLYEYNKNNDVIHRQCYRMSDGSLWSESHNEYRYDAKGNWIECREYNVSRSERKKETLPDYITERKIIYY